MEYSLKIFVAGMPGYFHYEIDDKHELAIDHLTNIARDGYRRVDERGQMVHYMPRVLEKMILVGPNIKSDYPDKVVIT